MTLLIISCTPPVVFDQAYPSDQEDLLSIPTAYQGAFLCESDSAIVTITDHHIVLQRTNYFNTGIKQIEERDDCKIIDDKMYVSGRLECIPITIVNDTIIRGTYEETDTLFVMQQGSVARLYNGHLVINQELRNNEWAVSLLTPESGGDMSYKAITNATNIKNVGKITPLWDITSERDKKPRYKVRPTMTEFEALLKSHKVFIECEYLTRVHLDGAFLN